MKDITNHALKAHVHPSGFARLCCFETLFCQMQCFEWMTHLRGVHFFHAWPKLDSTHTEHCNFQLPENHFSGLEGVQCILGEHEPLKGDL